MIEIWVVIALAAIVIEIITIDLVSIWFVFGALAAIISALCGLSQTAQIIIFLAVSFIIIIGVRPLAKKYLRTNSIPTNTDRFIGKKALVINDILEDKRGEIKIDGQTWSATTLNHQPLEKGKHCLIRAISGAHMIVEEIKENK